MGRALPDRPSDQVRDSGESIYLATGLLSRRSLEPLYDVNRRLIDLMTQGARQENAGVLSLVSHLKDLLLRLTPEMRGRAAERAILLTDLQFADLAWWQSARDHPARPVPTPSWRRAFPRATALQLARATLTLTWHSLRVSPQSAVLLGVLPRVAEVIVGLTPLDIDRIVEGRFRAIRPRWEDRPSAWRALLQAAESEDFRKMRDFNLYSLQLLTGDLWSSGQPTKGVL